MRILSFDIECANSESKFPSPKGDPVIQIANVCQIHGEDGPFIRNVFCFKQCAPILGTQVLSFEREEDMLFAWREFVRLVDPDVITGFNINNFDFPYIIERAEALNMLNFSKFSRITSMQSKIRDSC